MIKIIAAKVAARKTIKARLEKEIPLINEVIQKAKEAGDIRVYYSGEISKATVIMLEKAGYVVNHWDVWDVKTEITWYPAYNKLVDNPSEVEKIAKEAGLDIVEMQ